MLNSVVSQLIYSNNSKFISICGQVVTYIIGENYLLRFNVKHSGIYTYNNYLEDLKNNKLEITKIEILKHE